MLTRSSNDSNPIRWLIVGVTLVISGVLLFARLGHYALWDDEAYTALAGKAVWATGDTSAVVGHNIVAYRNGMVLRNLHDRATPPLPAYIAAPFLGIFGDSAFVARLPFTLLGFATIALMLRWAWRDSDDPLAMLILCIAIVGNVSLTLYSRQCRYYAPSLFFCVAIAYLYLHYDGRRSTLVPLLLASVALLANNYLHFLSIYVCLGTDYFIWGRHRRRLSLREWLILLVPQFVIGAIIASIWNPLRVGSADYQQSKTVKQWFELMWMNLRDMNRCEFGPMLLLAFAPVVYFFTRDRWLLRASVVFVPFVVIVSILSPQNFLPGSTVSNLQADIRYVVAVLPLCIALATILLCQIRGRWRWISVALSLMIFGSNVVNQISELHWQMQSTLWSYIGELRHPLSDPYTATADWINKNVNQDQSIWVVPTISTELASYQIYPLMFHAPKAIYAWQFSNPPPAQFAHLPEIHVSGRVAPDYIIAFGPTIFDLLQHFHPPAGVSYVLTATVDVYFHDEYRPELFWRTFTPLPVDREHGSAIYIFKEQASAPAPLEQPTQPPEPPPRSDFRL